VKKKDDLLLGKTALDLANVAGARKDTPLTVNLAIKPQRKSDTALGMTFTVFAEPVASETEFSGASVVATTATTTSTAAVVAAAAATPREEEIPPVPKPHKRFSSLSASVRVKHSDEDSMDATVSLALRASETTILAQKKRIVRQLTA